MSEWQLIETAPKEPHCPDRVLLYGTDCGLAFGRIYKWPDGQIICSAEGYSGKWNITHWMPLPEPPQ